MPRRFAASGLARRSARAVQRAGTSAAPAPTFAEILAGYIVAEYDAAAGITVTGQGVSLHDDAIGSRDLLQTTDAKRPPYTSAGALSYYSGDAITRQLASAAGADLTGGDICTITVAKLNSLATNKIILGLGDGTTNRTTLRTHAAGTNFLAIVEDGVGDFITGPTSDTSLHCFILRNVVGVSRRFYVDGGAGVAGARTTALSGAHTVVGALGGSNISNPVDARFYYAAICKPVPTVAVLNTLGAAMAARFGTTWSTLS